jgi:hypothetical protein
MSTIYILALEHGKYYVGKSDQLESRILTHFSSGGSAWTRAHKPVRIYGSYPSSGHHDEDEYTLRMMGMFGIDNVRGGLYCRLVLDEAEILMAKKRIASAEDACLICFNTGHFF